MELTIAIVLYTNSLIIIAYYFIYLFILIYLLIYLFINHYYYILSEKKDFIYIYI